MEFLSMNFSEYVRNLGNIEKYNCERKMEYIKKGMGELFSTFKNVTLVKQYFSDPNLCR